MGFVWVDDKDDDAKFKSHLEAKITEATTSLTTSNEGLKKDLAKLKKKVKEKEDIDIDEFNRLKTENEQLKDKKKEGESELEKALRIAQENHKKESEKLAKRIEAMESRDRKNLVDAQINAGLAEVKVKPALLAAARKIIEADVSIIEDEETGEKKAVVGDKTIKDHIVTWAGTDEGKNFVLAPNNKGGNSNGGDGDGDSDEVESFFDKKSRNYNVTKQIMLKKTDPARYDMLKAKFKL